MTIEGDTAASKFSQAKNPDEFRLDLVNDVEAAIKNVRELVEKMSDREKEHMRINSRSFRQLITAVSNWLIGRRDS